MRKIALLIFTFLFVVKAVVLSAASGIVFFPGVIAGVAACCTAFRKPASGLKLLFFLLITSGLISNLFSKAPVI